MTGLCQKAQCGSLKENVPIGSEACLLFDAVWVSLEDLALLEEHVTGDGFWGLRTTRQSQFALSVSCLLVELWALTCGCHACCLYCNRLPLPGTINHTNASIPYLGRCSITATERKGARHFMGTFWQNDAFKLKVLMIQTVVNFGCTGPKILKNCMWPVPSQWGMLLLIFCCS